VGRKQVVPYEAENYLAEHCLLMEFFGLTMADVMRLAYQLAVITRIKNQFFSREMKRLGRSGWEFPTSSPTNFS